MPRGSSNTKSYDVYDSRAHLLIHVADSLITPAITTEDNEVELHRSQIPHG